MINWLQTVYWKWPYGFHFCYFQILYMKSTKSYWSPWVLKSEIQIRDVFPAKPEKSNIHKIKLPQKISCRIVNCVEFFV